MFGSRKFLALCFGLVFCTQVVECAYGDPGLVTSGSIGFIARTLRTQKRELVNDEVAQMVTQVRQLLAGYDDFSKLDNTTVWGAIGMDLNNPYGGKYELTVDPDDSHYFMVSITGLSQTDCDYYLTKTWTDSAGYIESGGDNGGAVGECDRPDGENVVSIKYGE